MKISKEKVEALAKRSHAKCHGTGILGYRAANQAVLCTCVIRNLRRKDVNINNRDEVGRFLAPDLSPASSTAETEKHPPGWPYDKTARPGPIKAE